MLGIQLQTTMTPKGYKLLVAILVAATIILAGIASYEGISYVNQKNKGTALSNNYDALMANYDNQQYSVVLKDALQHWDYVSMENLSLVSPQYLPNATLDWIGGPLSGTYTGISEINSTWTKFFNAWSAVWFYTISPPTVTVNGNLSTVTSMNQFVLTPINAPMQVNYLNISYTLNYMKIGNSWFIYKETWHIVNSGYISYKQQGVALQAVTANAFSHWDAIAIENTSLLQPQYDSNATLSWIGGPLTGTYSGVSDIINTWNKFFGLWNAVWFYAETPPVVTVTGATANVTSTVQFILTPVSDESQVQYLNISYTLNFYEMNGQWEIFKEVWHIVGTGYISAAEQTAIYNAIDSLAFNHWNNIAIQNNTTVLDEYAPNATLYWIGGPLNGTYTGLTEINTTWNKFFGLWSAVWFYTESPPTIMVNGNVITVNATVQFIVQNMNNKSQFEYINVTYGIKYYDSGFNLANGNFRISIVQEMFEISGKGPLSTV